MVVSATKRACPVLNDFRCDSFSFWALLLYAKDRIHVRTKLVSIIDCLGVGSISSGVISAAGGIGPSRAGSGRGRPVVIHAGPNSRCLICPLSDSVSIGKGDFE